MDNTPSTHSNLLPGDDKLVFKRSHLYAVLLPLAFVTGLSVGFLFWGRGTSPVVAPSAAQADVPAEEQAVRRYDVPEDDDPSIGPAGAPITIIEFSDYECPYCQRWYQEVYHQLLKDYSGEVRIVFRDFPLTSIHPNATPAAEAANCAGEQDKYWEFHDLLFGGGELGDESYFEYASQLGMDVEKFKTCYEEGRYRDEVVGDYQYAASLGVRSTPTFFINGIPVVGAQPYDVFKEVIDKELAGEIP